MPLFTDLANARMRSLDRGRQEQVDLDEREQRKIQRAALLAGLQEQGISRQTTPGVVQYGQQEIADTGFVLDPSQTPQGKQRALQMVTERKRQEVIGRRKAILKVKNPTLDDNALTALAEDDHAFQDAVKPHDPRNIDPLSPQGMQAQQALARYRAGLRPPKQERVRPLPSSAVEKLTGIDNMLTMATDVQGALQDAVKKKVNATGRVFGVIPTKSWVKNVAGMGGDKGKDIRALLGNLYGTVAKERGGTALSAPELDLLESYLPNENDPEDTAVIKAGRFINTLTKLRQNKIKAYQHYGYGGVMDDEGSVADQLEDDGDGSAAASPHPRRTKAATGAQAMKQRYNLK